LRSVPQAPIVASMLPVVTTPAVQPSLVTSVPTMVTSTAPSPPILRSRTTSVSSSVQGQEGGDNTEQSLALRSGRFFHRRYPQQPQPQANATEPAEAEEEPISIYDLLKQLDQTPAKITILDLIRRSRSHQKEMYKFLQKVMVDENLPQKGSLVLCSHSTVVLS